MKQTSVGNIDLITLEEKKNVRLQNRGSFIYVNSELCYLNQGCFF